MKYCYYSNNLLQKKTKYANLEISTNNACSLNSKVHVISQREVGNLPLGAIWFFPKGAVVSDCFGRCNGTLYAAMRYKDFYLQTFYSELNQIQQDEYLLYDKLYGSPDWQPVIYNPVPIMTSNTTPAPFKVTFSTSYFGNSEYKVFSRGTDISEPGWHSHGSTPHYIQIELDSFYKLHSYNVSTFSWTMKNWSILGLNSLDQWVTLDTRVVDSQSYVVYSFDIDDYANKPLCKSFCLSATTNPVRMHKLNYFCEKIPFFKLPDLDYMCPAGFETWMLIKYV